MVSSVIDTEVHEDGSYVAKLDPASNYAQKHGTIDFTIDKVDLNAGTEGRRRANW